MWLTNAVVARLQDINLTVKVKALHEELSRLSLKLISKLHDLMDFHSRLEDKDMEKDHRRMKDENIRD